MGTNLIYAHTTDEHVRHVAENMRSCDAEEVRLSHGHDPLTALQTSVNITEEPITVLSPDGVPLTIMGIIPKHLLSDTGIIWMLGCDDALRFRRHFLTDVPKVLDIWLERYKMLENYVHVLNTVTVNWLDRLGFEFDEPFNLHNGASFVRFHMEK